MFHRFSLDSLKKYISSKNQSSPHSPGTTRTPHLGRSTTVWAWSTRLFVSPMRWTLHESQLMGARNGASKNRENTISTNMAIQICVFYRSVSTHMVYIFLNWLYNGYTISTNICAIVLTHNVKARFRRKSASAQHKNLLARSPKHQKHSMSTSEHL